MKLETNYFLNNDISDNTKRLSSLEFSFICFVLLYFILPIVSSAIPFLVAIILFVCYATYLYITKSREGNISGFLILTTAIFTLLHVFFVESSTISQSNDYFIKRFFSKYNQIFTIFFPAIVFLRIKRLSSKKQKKILLYIIIALYTFVLLNTMIELIVNPRASRNWAEFSEQAEGNVGTYAFVYSVTLLISILPFWLFNKNKTKKFIVICIILVLFYFLLLAQYTLAFLIAIIGLVLQVINSLKNNSVKLLLFIFLIFLLLLIPSILNFLSEKITSSDISIRLKEIAGFFSGENKDGYNLNGRLTLYKQTIVAFINNPILGNRNLGFDGHATFLTVFADLGLIGGGIFICMFYKTKKILSFAQNKNANKIFKIAFICYIFMGLTNPIHYTQVLSITLWLVIPIIIDNFNKEKL